MEAVFEITEITFVLAGHTKFAPDRPAVLVKTYYSSDIFNEDFIHLYQQHADVTIDHGKIVRCWSEIVTKKYSNLPGIRVLHDFVAIKNKIKCNHESSRDLLQWNTSKYTYVTV